MSDAGDDLTRVHVFVDGRVQGVTYRASTRDAARERGVEGWVKNLGDGRVEAVFEGPEAAVESLVKWCQEGPTRARVESVETTTEPPEGVTGFEIR
jgi:acylphosphatase